jgi:uncharacterized membrane protein
MMSARRIAILAVSVAMVAALIIVIPVPIPATGGYTHPGAVAEIFIALAFGPVVGMIAAGLGAASADLLLGFGSFAPLSLVAHGALGFLAGSLGWKRGLRAQVAGWILGGLALILVYFLGEVTLYRLGLPAAAVEIPVNAFQVSLGILGITLYKLVKAAYPQIELLGGEGPKFKQE